MNRMSYASTQGIMYPPFLTAANYGDKLSHRYLGSSSTWCSTKSRKSSVYSTRIDASNQRFETKVPDNASESLDVTLKAATIVGMPASNILVIDDSIDGYVRISDLIIHGETAPLIDEIAFSPRDGGRRLALLCYSSGTYGLPKGVLMSHRNLIANICQGYEFSKHGPYFGTDRVAIGVLPFYHSITFFCAG